MVFFPIYSPPFTFHVVMYLSYLYSIGYFLIIKTHFHSLFMHMFSILKNLFSPSCFSNSFIFFGHVPFLDATWPLDFGFFSRIFFSVMFLFTSLC